WQAVKLRLKSELAATNWPFRTSSGIMASSAGLKNWLTAAKSNVTMYSMGKTGTVTYFVSVSTYASTITPRATLVSTNIVFLELRSTITPAMAAKRMAGTVKQMIMPATAVLEPVT